MIDLKDIRSLSDFQRNARQYAQHLKETKKPVVLTVNGKAELVVQDAASYQELLEMVEQLETVLALKEGMKDVDEGRTRPARAALEELREKHGIPR